MLSLTPHHNFPHRPPLLRADLDEAGVFAGDNATVTRVADPADAARDAWLECNGRGVCNREFGTCTCADGFQSSDGSLGPGQTGDCGFEERLWGAKSARVNAV